VPLSQDRAKYRVDKTSGARFPRGARQIHRIVDDSRRRHTIEVEQLIDAQTQDRQHVRVQFVQRPPGVVADDVIETALPAHRTGDDLRCQRPIAFVTEVRSHSRNGRWKLDAASGDCPQRMEGARACRRNHDAAKTKELRIVRKRRRVSVTMR